MGVEVTACLCSGNEHKAEELRAALPGWSLELLGTGPLPPEGEESYEANARAKARFGREVGLREAWMLGEDSGIEVEALGGAPGIHSARWADEPVAALLRELGGIAERGARYVCALVAISPQGEEISVRGTLEGRVAIEPRGSEGFGYDPIFVPDISGSVAGQSPTTRPTPGGETRTVAELGNEWKRANSHRARAAHALLNAVRARS